MSSLFEKLGGESAISDVVDIFYEKVLADDSVSHFFFYSDMAAQHVKQQLFMTMVFGGQNNYTSDNLRTAHAPLVQKGLNEEHFNIVAGYLQATLEEMDVPAELIDEVMTIASSYKDDVLNR